MTYLSSPPSYQQRSPACYFDLPLQNESDYSYEYRSGKAPSIFPSEMIHSDLFEESSYQRPVGKLFEASMDTLNYVELSELREKKV